VSVGMGVDIVDGGCRRPSRGKKSGRCLPSDYGKPLEIAQDRMHIHADVLSSLVCGIYVAITPYAGPPPSLASFC
jgi:hypothetical protein